VNVRVVLGKLRCNTVYKITFSTSTQHSHLLNTHADVMFLSKFMDEHQIFFFNSLKFYDKNTETVKTKIPQLRIYTEQYEYISAAIVRMNDKL
jgi:hypothetical protein